MARYFGERWDAPAFDDAEQIPTPVDALCMECREPIAVGDRGAMMMAGKIVDGSPVGHEEPLHLECYLRMMLGSIDHLLRQCSCFGGPQGHGPPNRESARAVLAWAGRAQQGLRERLDG